MSGPVEMAEWKFICKLKDKDFGNDTIAALIKMGYCTIKLFSSLQHSDIDNLDILTLHKPALNQLLDELKNQGPNASGPGDLAQIEFETKLKDQGISDDIIAALIKNGCNTIKLFRSIRNADIDILEIPPEQKSALKKLLDELKNERPSSSGQSSRSVKLGTVNANAQLVGAEASCTVIKYDGDNLEIETVNLNAERLAPYSSYVGMDLCSQPDKK